MILKEESDQSYNSKAFRNSNPGQNICRWGRDAAEKSLRKLDFVRLYDSPLICKGFCPTPRPTQSDSSRTVRLPSPARLANARLAPRPLSRTCLAAPLCRSAHAARHTVTTAAAAHRRIEPRRPQRTQRPQRAVSRRVGTRRTRATHGRLVPASLTRLPAHAVSRFAQRQPAPAVCRYAAPPPPPAPQLD